MKAGWEVRPLGEVASRVSTGPFGSLLGTKDYRDAGIPVINPIDIVDGVINGDTAKRISGKTAESLAQYRLLDGDVVVARRGELGRCAVVTSDQRGWVCGTGSFYVRPGANLVPAYLSLFLGSPDVREQFEVASTGATMPNISNRTLAGLRIPLPPLEEQHRIVAVLDEAFEGLARARAHAEANLQNARELFENSLEAEFEGRHHWGHSKLGDHIDLLAGYAFKSAGYTDDASGMRLMRGDNIVPGGVRWEGVKYWPLNDCKSYEKFQLLADDVLIAMDRTWIKSGIKYAVLTDDDVPSILVQRVARLRCLPNLDTKFLAMLIGGKSFEKYVVSIQTGTGVPHISPTQIKDFSFPLPDLHAQQQIAERLSLMETQCNALALAYEAKIQSLDALRQSLLQKGFAGELI